LSRPEQKLFVLLIALGLITSLWVGWQRTQVEAASRTVELAADWGQVQEVANSVGRPPIDLLRELSRAGVTGVSVTEDTPSSLRDQGLLTIRAVPQAAVDGQPAVTTLISSPSPEVLNRVGAFLAHRLGVRVRKLIAQAPGEGPLLAIPGTLDPIRSMGVGLPEADVRMLRAQGFDILGRISNFPVKDTGTLEWATAQLKAEGARVVLFSGEEVLGYLDLLKDTAAALEAQGLVYGSVEFSKQRGDESLSQNLHSGLVRVHSVASNEIGKLRVPELVDRYVRAVEERNIRVCYLRLPTFATKDADQSLVDYVSQIRTGLQAAGFQLGQAGPFTPFEPPRVAHLVMGAGSTAALFLLLTWIFPLGTSWWILLYVVGTATDLSAMFVVGNFARRYLALKAALVFPALAGIWAYRRALSTVPDRGHVTAPRSTAPLLDVLGASVMSLGGAVFVVGLLSDRDFMMRTYQFMGIKAAHVLPLIGLALVLGLDFLAGPQPWQEQWDRLKERSKRLLDQPLITWQVLVGLVAAGAILFLLLRTGNDPGVGVSSLELRLRGLLDRILLVRPRTKEFLVGHPFLFLAFALAPKLSRRALVALLLVGFIGQVSLVNTFCHIHTPLHVSILRILNGLWVGLVFGALLTAAVRPFLGERAKAVRNAA
jgi:hypothetical protein